VLISRENASAANALAAALKQTTAATFVGEPTPARPETPGDETTITLPNSGIIVHIPTTLLFPQGAGDPGDTAVKPDVAVDLTATDFFADKDRAIEIALKRR
jgi:C-terminal processing protease CtpA/Prc